MDLSNEWRSDQSLKFADKLTGNPTATISEGFLFWGHFDSVIHRLFTFAGNKVVNAIAKDSCCCFSLIYPLFDALYKW